MSAASIKEMAIDLFDDGSDDDAAPADEELKINEEFARRLEHNKRREALHRLEDLKKRGLAGQSSSDSGSDEEDDEDADLGKSAKEDVKYLDTLVRVKKQDPAIFEKDNKIYSSYEGEGGDEEGDVTRKQNKGVAKKEQPLYLKDVNARLLIEEGPEFEDKPLKHHSKIYNKEQAQGIKAFLEAEKAEFADSDDDILMEKEKAAEEDEQSEGDAKEVYQKLDEYFGKDDDLDENDKFLKDYLRNRMWVDKVRDKKSVIDDIGVSEDEEELEMQDRYEAEYNFRHEEIEADRVLGHSRIIEGSVRKKTSTRKIQRKNKEKRMVRAEFDRKEEVKHLKNIKKKEIQEKLDKIRAIAGMSGDGPVNLVADDLDDDFDPEEYDKKMKEMFGDDYYGTEDVDPGFGSEEEGNFEKPDFDKEDELLGLPKDWDVGASSGGFEAAREKILKRKHEEEPQDDGLEEVTEEEEPQDDGLPEAAGEGKRKRKRKISLKEKVELDKELEEYYKLDYEDTIGDIKTRFKYRSVPANRYGLSPEEILMANEKDLNQYVSLKKLAPYREKEWKVTYHQKKKKSLILHDEKLDKSNIKQHKSKESSHSAEAQERKDISEAEQTNGEGEQLSRRERKKKRQAELKLSESRLMAYGKLAFKTQKKH